MFGTDSCLLFLRLEFRGHQLLKMLILFSQQQQQKQLLRLQFRQPPRHFSIHQLLLNMTILQHLSQLCRAPQRSQQQAK